MFSGEGSWLMLELRRYVVGGRLGGGGPSKSSSHGCPSVEATTLVSNCVAMPIGATPPSKAPTGWSVRGGRLCASIRNEASAPRQSVAVVLVADERFDVTDRGESGPSAASDTFERASERPPSERPVGEPERAASGLTKPEAALKSSCWKRAKTKASARLGLSGSDGRPRPPLLPPVTTLRASGRQSSMGAGHSEGSSSCRRGTCSTRSFAFNGGASIGSGSGAASLRRVGNASCSVLTVSDDRDKTRATSKPRCSIPVPLTPPQ
mmetsp:Transcript_38345/g.63475  ORF Transcript_38345/g.63475 Transcript_38345/m.63475 type:complete len:265 (-) Transcript_38345:167-961(-)